MLYHQSFCRDKNVLSLRIGFIKMQYKNHVRIMSTLSLTNLINATDSVSHERFPLLFFRILWLFINMTMSECGTRSERQVIRSYYYFFPLHAALGFWGCFNQVVCLLSLLFPVNFQLYNEQLLPLAFRDT